MILARAGNPVEVHADVNGPVPDLTNSTKTVSTPHADPGEVVTYTINLINSGGTAGQPILVTDTVPAGLTYLEERSVGPTLGKDSIDQGTKVIARLKAAATQPLKTRTRLVGSTTSRS